MSQLRLAWPSEQTGDPTSAFVARNIINSGFYDSDYCYPYEHEPLDAESFRILHLLPADQLYDTLKCEIEHVPLPKSGNKNVPYTALSYVWGKDHASSCKVIVPRNGHIRIRRSLDSALRHLRQHDTIITLWIDALCIDQSNIQERNHQVQHMRQIYETAEETIVYLGPQDGGNTGLSAWNYLERSSSWALNEKGETDFDAPRKLNNLTAFRGDIHDICNDILPREWFCRLWVLQEFVVSKRVSLQCGNRRVPGDTLFRLLLFEPRNIDIYGHWAREDELVEPISHIWTTRVAFHIARNQQQYLPSWCKDASETVTTNLLDTLVRTKSLVASDPRDKIIGLLGISSGFDWQSNNTVDYNLTTRELYTKFAHDFLRTEHGFRILGCRDGKPIPVPMNKVRRILLDDEARLQGKLKSLQLNMGTSTFGSYSLWEERIQQQEMMKAALYKISSLLAEGTSDEPLHQMLKYLQHEHRTPVRSPSIDDEANRLSMPSWVPTWQHRSSSTHYEPRPIVEVLHSRGAIPIRYRPSDVGAFLLTREDRFEDILRVHGKVLGVVSTLMSPCRLRPSQENRFMSNATKIRRNSQSGSVALEASIVKSLADMLDENAILEVDPELLKNRTCQTTGEREPFDRIEIRRWSFLNHFRKNVFKHSELAPTFKNYFDSNNGRFLTESIEYHLVKHVSNLLIRSVAESRNGVRQAGAPTANRQIFRNRAIGLYRPFLLDDHEVHNLPSHSNESPPRQKIGSNVNPERVETDREQSEQGGKGLEDKGHEQVLEWTPGTSRGLTLLPLEVEFGDLIVYFPGAQVPFIVRRLENSATAGLDRQDSTDGLRFADDIEHHIHCKLVGECWINDFPQIEQEMGKLDCLFHIS